jgi:BirA family biotin operon repressor/biotin-[acetyl-CoA-carboxylase] ligase
VSTQFRLLELLSDGEWHSGEELGALLHISRAAVSKQIKNIADLGIALESQKGVGYRSESFELLDEHCIRSQIQLPHLADQVKVTVCQSIPSTNQKLLDEFNSGEDVRGRVCFAECQTAGRGRRGREWFSPFAKNLYFSLAWRFEGGVAEIEGLSLAVGVVICQVLEGLDFHRASLKWPNDILVGGKKLGGVLIELGGDATSDCTVVVGVGLNVDMFDASEVDQPWVSLKQSGFDKGRNALAGSLASSLLDLLSTYSQVGFSSYKEEWIRRSAFQGREVCLSSARSEILGVMSGVGDQGELLLELDDGLRSFVGGELSLRPS